MEIVNYLMDNVWYNLIVFIVLFIVTAASAISWKNWEGYTDTMDSVHLLLTIICGVTTILFGFMAKCGVLLHIVVFLIKNFKGI